MYCHCEGASAPEAILRERGTNPFPPDNARAARIEDDSRSHLRRRFRATGQEQSYGFASLHPLLQAQRIRHHKHR